LWRAALGQLWRSSGAASGISFGEQLSGTTLGSNFVNIEFWNNCGVQRCGAAFDDTFWE